MDSPSRRTFLKVAGATAVATGAAAGLYLTRRKQKPRMAPVVSLNQEKIRIGFIGVGMRGSKLVDKLCAFRQNGENIDLSAISEVYEVNRDRTADLIKESTGHRPTLYRDYREMFEKENLEAVCIATPDHWHARHTIDAMNRGLHVYCEKPMTRTIDEASDVVKVWEDTSRIMQVGVQATSQSKWQKCRDLIVAGKIGKVLQFQTDFFRNSAVGQWREYKLDERMTPKTIDWERWLGVEEGLAENIPFDREIFAQWRRFWPFGGGMFTDLFVHRISCMLRATGLKFPARVVGAGGIYLEYDGRQVPDVGTVVADYQEGVQGIVTATMCCQNSPIDQVVRGHFGSLRFGDGNTLELIPEAEEITRDSSLKREKFTCADLDEDTTIAHFRNWLDAIRADDPTRCNNTPDLGAAAVVTVDLAIRSYREGHVYFFDPSRMRATNVDPGWAAGWERMSADRSRPHQVPGWKGGDYGSLLQEPKHMALAGEWVDGRPTANTPRVSHSR